MVGSSVRKKDLEKTAVLVRQLGELASGEDDAPAAETQLLAVGCELFDLEIGIVARVQDDCFRVVAVQAPSDVDIEPGTAFALEETFSSQTIAANGPVHIRSTKSAGLTDHPAHKALGIQAYLGAPIQSGDKVFGTLSFSSRSARKTDFGLVELDCLRLMASWLGIEMARRRAEDALGATRDQLNRLAIQDPVTGVLNRRAVLENLSDERNRASRSGSSVGVFLVNIDRLREINTSYGHHTGDALLREIAGRIGSSLRAYDHLGRFGGGEFLAVLPGCDLPQATEIAERAREALEGSAFAVNGSDVMATGSFGVSSTDNEKLSDDTLLGFADRALFLAKARGRNIVRGVPPQIEHAIARV